MQRSNDVIAEKLEAVTESHSLQLAKLDEGLELLGRRHEAALEEICREMSAAACRQTSSAETLAMECGKVGERQRRDSAELRAALAELADEVVRIRHRSEGSNPGALLRAADVDLEELRDRQATAREMRGECRPPSEELAPSGVASPVTPISPGAGAGITVRLRPQMRPDSASCAGRSYAGSCAGSVVGDPPALGRRGSPLIVHQDMASVDGTPPPPPPSQLLPHQQLPQQQQQPQHQSRRFVAPPPPSAAAAAATAMAAAAAASQPPPRMATAMRSSGASTPVGFNSVGSLSSHDSGIAGSSGLGGSCNTRPGISSARDGSIGRASAGSVRGGSCTIHTNSSSVRGGSCPIRGGGAVAPSSDAASRANSPIPLVVPSAPPQLRIGAARWTPNEPPGQSSAAVPSPTHSGRCVRPLSQRPGSPPASPLTALPSAPKSCGESTWSWQCPPSPELGTAPPSPAPSSPAGTPPVFRAG
eukprot:NODE_912_length_2701_cov_3.221057.p1 GENE.NODE_912_length_2701_cov_3.221057~~NODE_912_length_2701_cov_3.221057.p1  ORF type:complete len:475 (+),score=144.58 NODE_912_length_2701_cov_3.221057:977-2401(+)